MKIYYILIWKYHDTNVEYYDDLMLLNNNLSALKYEYRNDSDFSYRIFEARELYKK